MKLILLLTVAIQTLVATKGLTCGPTSVYCVSPNQYLFCVNNYRGEGVLVGNAITCPGNTICNARSWFPCVDNPNPQPSVTTSTQSTTLIDTLAPTTPQPTTINQQNPSTTGSTTAPVQITTTPVQGTVTPGETTTIKTRSTTKDTPSSTADAPTTTTAPKTTLPPTTPGETTATPGETTTIKTRSTIKDSLSSTNTADALTTTTPPKTTLPPITVPECSQTGGGKFPNPNCNQFYECATKLWWWELRTGTCQENQLYDVELRDCAPAETVNCLQRV